WLSPAGLRYALAEALARHRRAPREPAPPAAPPPRTAEQYPAARRLGESACIHCHHVNEVRREAARDAGTWRPEEVGAYPPPENVGLTLDKGQGDRVRAVHPHSAAARAGLRAGDRLRGLGGAAVASFGDVQYALHRAPPRGILAVTW